MKVRVLLVDDRDDARSTLAERLRRGSRLELVGAASDIGEAADLLAAAQPDIVLLDLHHGDGEGIELCRGLRCLTEAPVVALTSFMTPQLWEEAKAAGAADYLLKHVDTDRLSCDMVRLAARHRGETATAPDSSA